MKTLHIVVPDLILPRQLAEYACNGLNLPCLERLLARSACEKLKVESLEAWLCEQFGLHGMPIAPVTLLADGVQPENHFWLRADPVAVQMQQGRLLLQSIQHLKANEAESLCASLNAHFATDGFQFIAPHPQRWYLRLNDDPGLMTVPVSRALGADFQEILPEGKHAMRWNALLNEIQMLFHGHGVNEAREGRGEMAVSGVWLWGGGRIVAGLRSPYTSILAEEGVALAFAQATGMKESNGMPELLAAANTGDALLVWEGLAHAIQSADIAGWRSSLIQMEETILQPAWKAMLRGDIRCITLDVLREGDSRRFVATRRAGWAWWRRARRLQNYAAD